MSPDTVSSLFPDRPIRPLPKRRLREKLSPEVAGSIKYPPSTHQDPAPLFHYPPYTVRDDGSPPRFGLSDGSRRVDLSRNYTPRRGGEAVVPADDADTNSRSSLVARSSPEILSRALLQQTKFDQPQPLFAPAPSSVTSSVDGYDSFENTSNKKKRKIPSAADSALNSAHGLVADIGSNSTPGSGVSVHDMPDNRFYNNVPSYSAPVTLGSGSPGISGSGRGRLGRVRSGRSPLGALPDGNMTWSGRMSKSGNALWASEYEGSSIISSAIAKAEKLPPQGQENVSLLQQHSASSKTSPGTTQFTFTCNSQVPGSLQWPGHTSKHSMGHDYSTLSATHGNASINDASPKAAGRGSGTSRRKSRRQLDRELAAAACDRRDAAATNYYNNPPKLEDIWVCEFCEYERIFGEPPRALIREYELKDRRVRQEEADRKRLLEKAKAKGRKGKKSGKAAAKGGNAPMNQPDSAQGDEHDVPPPVHSGNGPSGHSEGDEEDNDSAEYKEGAPSPHMNGQRTVDDDRGGGGNGHRQPSMRPPDLQPT